MKVVFLDRDGVINKYPGDFKYVTSWDEFHFLPRVIPSLKRLLEQKFNLFIISNQAGVSKGIFSQASLDLITKNMLRELEGNGINISGVYYCIHREDENCPCRKPKTGLIDLALAHLKKNGLKIERESSYFIGDTIRDVHTGKAAGLKTLLVFSGKEKAQNRPSWEELPDYTARDLSQAVDLITGSP